MEEYKPIVGKTYSLFGQDTTTGPFFRKISALTNEVLARLSIPEDKALGYIQALSRNKRKLRLTAAKPGRAVPSNMLHRIDAVLSTFTPGIEQHLKQVSLHKYISDKELFTSREQYYLYLIEFELVNRIHRERFLAASYRIALLPYCLKERQSDCKARPDEIDYECRRCLKTCYINQVSALLRDHGVHPYIWSRTSLKTMFRKLITKHGSIGVLGIACIVELIRGMRRCMKAGLPVMGIPLNANRCARWMDELHDTSVDLAALEKILNGELRNG